MVQQICITGTKNMSLVQHNMCYWYKKCLWNIKMCLWYNKINVAHFQFFNVCVHISEYVPCPRLRDITEEERDGHRTRIRGRSPHDRTYEPLGPAGRLSHPQCRLTTANIVFTRMTDWICETFMGLCESSVIQVHLNLWIVLFILLHMMHIDVLAMFRVSMSWWCHMWFTRISYFSLVY